MTATVTETTEEEATATETEGGVEAAGEAAMTDVSAIDIVAAPEIMMTIPAILPVMKMTAAVTSVRARTTFQVADPARTVHPEENAAVVEVAVAAVAAGAGVRMGWGPPKGGHQHQKVLRLCRSANARPLVGMSTLLVTNSILLCKPNKQVTFIVLPSYHFVS